MSTFVEVMEKASNDRAFYANLIVNPTSALEGAGMELTSNADIVELEKVVEAAQHHLSVVARQAGFKVVVEAADWGVGASCCNVKVAE
jgi:hypothetical protein